MQLMLKQIREAKGLTQPEMAERLDMKLSTYRTWEQGTVKLTLENACHISIVLGCTPNDLCGWYLEHPREECGQPLTVEETEIVNCYRASAPQWQQNIAMTARAAAGESKRKPKIIYLPPKSAGGLSHGSVSRCRRKYCARPVPTA